MPKNITDVSEFTEPVVVPVNGDDRVAESVEVAFQALSNRTRYIKNTTDAFAPVTVIVGDSLDINISGGVAALRGIEPTDYAVSGTPVRAYIDYHTVPGDGGGGIVVRKEGAPGTGVDDDCTIFVPTGGDGSDFWAREITNVITPHMAGGDIQVAADAAVSHGVPLDLGGRGDTWVLDNPVVINDEITIVGNGATVDISSLGGTEYGIHILGSVRSTHTITTGVVAGDTIVFLDTTSGLVAGDWLKLQSSRVWSLTATLSEYVQIDSVDTGTRITLRSKVLYDYLLVDSPEMVAYDHVKNVKISGLTFEGTGASDTQAAIRVEHAYGANISDIDVHNVGYAGVIISNSIQTNVISCNFDEAITPGYAYGVAIINGSSYINISNITANYTRHAVTVGGTDGICRFINVTNSSSTNSRDSGFDCHYSSDHVKFRGLHVQCIASGTDGITMQGANLELIDTTVLNANRHGALVQMFPLDSNNLVIRNFKCTCSNASTGNLILVQAQSGSGEVEFIDIDGVFGSAPGNMVLIDVPAGQVVHKLRINDVKSSSPVPTHGIRIDLDSAEVKDTKISKCVVDVTGTSYALYYLMLGSSVASNISISDCSLSSYSDCVRLYPGDTSTVTDVNVCNNTCKMLNPGTGTGIYFITGGTATIRRGFWTGNLISGGAVSTRSNGDVDYIVSNDNIFVSPATTARIGVNPHDSIGTNIGGEGTGVFAQFSDISGGTVALNSSVIRWLTVDTEGAAASDDLDTISSTYARYGQTVIVRSTANARVVTVTTAGNIDLDASVVLDDVHKSLVLVWDGTSWKRG